MDYKYMKQGELKKTTDKVSIANNFQDDQNPFGDYVPNKKKRKFNKLTKGKKYLREALFFLVSITMIGLSLLVVAILVA